ncbi:MetQ/NlpA family ABC transporter substrate-binding protein [Ignavigranum ruoffiae]|uniref:MetQ/NlpA family ABC transporter substrate-binding protein n=1 Tax=Ignavigranum ruoffiae TaxID=89093 RepID=UPI002065247C|nr:MetQ/NlpA family ABC transporter substrate-binding protein [Ignavigranum ruoffiae]UPQ86013.1 MetQ/NlpA family ABC transporter substrate-binding protein [Ignavigranum ruoffiae]
MKKLTKVFVVLVTVFISFLNFSALASAGEFEGQTVKIGVVGEEYEELWEFVAESAKEQEGIDIEVVLLTDYNIPNVALADGSIDLNAFQHDVFLENWNKENDGDLVTIGYTVTVPTRIYSDKYKSLDELPEGAKIAVNAAPTSLGYNLQSLERAGLIKLAESDELLPTSNDIEENPKKLEIVELDAANIPAAVSDVDAAFIDDSFLASTDFRPNDAIYVYGDTPETINLSRVNNIVARSEDKENPLYLKIVELFQTDEVAQEIDRIFEGGSIAAWDLVEQEEKE